MNTLETHAKNRLTESEAAIAVMAGFQNKSINERRAPYAKALRLNRYPIMTKKRTIRAIRS